MAIGGGAAGGGEGTGVADGACCPQGKMVRSLYRKLSASTRRLPQDGLRLMDFMSLSTRHVGATNKASATIMAMRSDEVKHVGRGARFKLETYGCQMNVADSQLLRGILGDQGFREVDDEKRADVLLLNTCSIREKAEIKVVEKLRNFRGTNRRKRKEHRSVVCVLGCMAERLKTKLLEEDDLVDIIVGPDSYRDLPRLLAAVTQGEPGAKAYNVQLSLEETYADLQPVRTAGTRISAFVSIMRGCANMCTYCVVPFTRGRERSRSFRSILDEIGSLIDQGYKEVVLLGQNVNSYNDTSEEISDSVVTYADGFRTIYTPPRAGKRFPELVEAVCRLSPELRVRFTSPHPKDFDDELVSLYAKHRNLCPQIHLPAQSKQLTARTNIFDRYVSCMVSFPNQGGSSTVLERMGRGYTRESYIRLVEKIRSVRPDVALSSDFITGFCGETVEDHEATKDLIDRVGYEYAFVFPYSVRENTRAGRHLEDDVPWEVKTRRVNDLTKAWRATALERTSRRVGSLQRVLIEGPSDLCDGSLTGRTESNTRAVVYSRDVRFPVEPGKCVDVRVTSAGATTLWCETVNQAVKTSR